MPLECVSEWSVQNIYSESSREFFPHFVRFSESFLLPELIPMGSQNLCLGRIIAAVFH